MFSSFGELNRAKGSPRCFGTALGCCKQAEHPSRKTHDGTRANLILDYRSIKCREITLCEIYYVQELPQHIPKAQISLWIPDNSRFAGTHLQLRHRRLQRMVQTILLHGPENPPQAYICKFWGVEQTKSRLWACALEKLVTERDGHKFHEELVQVSIVAETANWVDYLYYAHRHNKLRSACVGIIRRSCFIIVPAKAKYHWCRNISEHKWGVDTYSAERVLNRWFVLRICWIRKKMMLFLEECTHCIIQIKSIQVLLMTIISDNIEKKQTFNQTHMQRKRK